jgi:hypothetical protein
MISSFADTLLLVLEDTGDAAPPVPSCVTVAFFIF